MIENGMKMNYVNSNKNMDQSLALLKSNKKMGFLKMKKVARKSEIRAKIILHK